MPHRKAAPQVTLLAPAPRYFEPLRDRRDTLSRLRRLPRLSLLALEAATPPQWDVQIIDERVEGFEPAARIGRPAFDGMEGSDAQIWASECALAGIQFEQHAGRRSMHPMSVLARAYREDGFKDLPEKK